MYLSKVIRRTLEVLKVKRDVFKFGQNIDIDMNKFCHPSSILRAKELGDIHMCTRRHSDAQKY